MADFPTPNGDPKAQMKDGLSGFFAGVRRFFYTLTDLKDGMDREGTITNIKSNKRMRGANAWLLMCSIMIASLGLDLNSPAIIIGAMLISPLMAPILGIGLGVGINDRNTLIISLQHFGMAIAIALITSTIYFLFTPFGEITPEISSRTAPTLLDAFVAFFGGIAGIISGSRKDKTNAIPGVAIATALMPPLCVTGFGIASLIRSGTNREMASALTNLNNFEVMVNSFYLFFLNAVLVALATFLIVRFLRFPVKKYEDAKEKRRTMLIVFGVSVLLLIPSVTLLTKVLEGIRENQAIRTALQQCFGNEMKYVDGWKKIKTDSLTNLLVKVYGPSMSQEIGTYRNRLQQHLPSINSEVIPTAEVNLAKFKTIQSQMDSLVNRIVVQPRSQQDRRVEQLEKELQFLKSDSLLEASIKSEVLGMYDKYLDQVQCFLPRVKGDPLMLSLSWSKQRNIPKAMIERSLKGYLQQRSHRDSVVISFISH